MKVLSIGECIGEGSIVGLSKLSNASMKELMH